MRRLILALILAIGLSPGLLWRNEPRPRDHSQSLTLTPLAVPHAQVGKDGPELTGAWRLRSPNTGFGSYSALLATGGNELLAISDHGQFARFPMPGTPAGPVALGPVLPGLDQYKPYQDMESATRDPATGTIWVGLEFRQSIMRFDKGFAAYREVHPRPMRAWRSNGGAEAMVRLADGRFAVLSESVPRGASERAGLLFAGDPADSGEPAQFSFVPPSGYDPSDMAQLPDGRVLILLRGLKFFPPGFAIRLVIADPADLRPGAEWKWRDVGALESPIPIDNYEGLAVTGGENGKPLTLWLISDDNGALLLQRSLLLRFEWQIPARK